MRFRIALPEEDREDDLHLNLQYGDNAVTPLSVDKYNRFLIDRCSNCMRQMRSKVTILAHTGSPMKALKTAVRLQKASLLTRAVISNRWIER